MLLFIGVLLFASEICPYPWLLSLLSSSPCWPELSPWISGPFQRNPWVVSSGSYHPRPPVYGLISKCNVPCSWWAQIFQWSNRSVNNSDWCPGGQTIFYWNKLNKKLRRIWKASCRWPTKVLWIPEISADKWPTPIAPNWFQISHTQDNGSRWAPPSGIPLVACGWHWWPQSAVRPRSWCEFQRERSVTERWIKFGEIMGGKIKIRITLPISLNRGVGLVIKLVHGNQMSYSLCVTNAIGCTV